MIKYYRRHFLVGGGKKLGTQSPKISECSQHTVSMKKYRLRIDMFINNQIAVAIGTCSIKVIKSKTRYLV